MTEPDSLSLQSDLVGSGASEPKKRKTASLSDAPGRDTSIFSLSSGRFQELLRKKGKGSTFKTILHISLEESAIAGKKMIEVARLTACDVCIGSSDRRSCLLCKGEQVEVQHNVEVSFPAGVLSGDVVVIIGSGNVAEDVTQEPGDLVVEIQVAPHLFLHRVGDDCHMQLPLSFVQATLGCSSHIRSLYGDIVLVVPPGTQCHTFITIPGEGFPVVLQGKCGVMVFKVLVVVPGTVSVESAALLRQFDQSMRDRLDGNMDSKN
jgi:DnaJ-class molecular chaperone